MRTPSIATAAMVALTSFAVPFATLANPHDAQGSSVSVVRPFSIAAQPAASALNEFARQADITLVFSFDHVAGANASLPSLLAPLAQLVIRESPRGYGVDGLTAERLMKQLKNERFASSGRRIDDDVLSSA